jgi:hypothetical protein
MHKRHLFLLISVSFLFLFSCRNEKFSVVYDFDLLNDRVWPGEDFWSVPLEDWRLKDGRIEYSGTGQQATCTVLPYMIEKWKPGFSISLEMGLLDKGSNDGASGLIIGSEAAEEKDHRAAIYFGRGINAGVNTEGYAFIEQSTTKLPEDFDFSRFTLEITGNEDTEGPVLTLKVTGADAAVLAEVVFRPEEPMSGIIQMVSNFRTSKSKNNGPRFWFDNIEIMGKGLTYRPENRYGPVLWAMHTLSRNTMKLSAQFPPTGKSDNQEVVLQIRKDKKWITAGTENIHPDSRTVLFSVSEWDSSVDHDYRILYDFVNIKGKPETNIYAGKIKRDPVDRQLKMGAMTCQYHTGFPYSPVVRNLALKEPDLLYFSGDQIYEQNGGYPIKREPEDMAILSYLGKWYMFGWAFGEAMRNTPAVCTPDDHDVFQGNIWGGGGIAKPQGLANTDDYTGFTQTVRMVNVVNRTQCSHLPDPYDPTPIEQGMSVWYTSMNYGRISFAIVSDRIFKSGPNLVARWEGRKDHITEPLKDPSIIERTDLEFLGERQEKFLEEWIRDWDGTVMKVLLSQTLFANAATHHGQFDGYLYGDMDSGGWPKKGRDRAVDIIRKGFVFHICGDQHVPSIVQYGIENFRDAGWAFCTPAIAVGYSRWFRPDELALPVINRPEHGFPNTGEYTDAFGNKNYVYAIGNPVNFAGIKNRYELQQNKTAGMGFVIFDKETRNITMESWHFLSDVLNPGEMSQHPGWPKTINQMDNYGREAVAWLPTLKISGDTDPVVEIINQTTGEPEYIVRINGNEFIPEVFSNDKFSVKVSYPEKELVKEFADLIPGTEIGKSELLIDFN